MNSCVTYHQSTFPSYEQPNTRVILLVFLYWDKKRFIYIYNLKVPQIYFWNVILINIQSNKLCCSTLIMNRKPKPTMWENWFLYQMFVSISTLQGGVFSVSYILCLYSLWEESIMLMLYSMNCYMLLSYRMVFNM